ncbi:MAG: hypothetical protein KDD66_16615, partial [Bdellovibrionales bacterium]|nr:hypothetical protein [Bdellovibrionales bacterium]
RNIADQYFADEQINSLNRTLFSFAAYNAGPTRISRIRQQAKDAGLDPNVWFGNVEQLVAKKVSSEPVTYVRNIYKYYVAYKLAQNNIAIREKAKDSAA